MSSQNNGGILGQLFTVVAVGAILYGAYKYGQSVCEEESKGPVDTVKSEIEKEFDLTMELINELKLKPNKNRKDRDNLDLLSIKLMQLQVKMNK
jgi:hypothetical protein